MQNAIRDTIYVIRETQNAIRKKLKRFTPARPIGEFHISRITSLRGFTLIELLVAMAIIGILVTLIGGNYISVKKKARDAQRKHDLEQLQRALEMYFNDWGTYPDGDANGQIVGCGIDPSSPSPCGWGNPWTLGSPLANPTLYIKTLPPDPKGYNYWYERPSPVSYKIFAYLENDQDSDIQVCIVILNKNCGAPEDCNYGVSSVNLGVCN